MTPRETIGVDLGGTKMAVGVVDSEQHIHYEGKEPSTGLSEERLVEDLGRELRGGEGGAPGRRWPPASGFPATIDHDRGVAIQAVNLEISDVPLRDLMRERIGLPVYLDNDANVAALAEHLYGAGRGARNVVMLTIGTGIGGGLILDGEIYRGSTGAAAELGHIVIVEDGLALPGQLPEPRLRRDLRLGHGARAGGQGRGRARAGLGARQGARRGADRRQDRDRAGDQGRRAGRARWWPRRAGTSASRWRASPTSSTPT